MKRSGAKYGRKSLDPKKRSQKQEKRVADLLGTRVQPGSGCLPSLTLKNDSIGEDILVENKYTDNKRQYTIKYCDLQKVVERALLQGKEPVMQLDLNELSPHSEFVVITLEFFAELLEKWRN